MCIICQSKTLQPLSGLTHIGYPTLLYAVSNRIDDEASRLAKDMESMDLFLGKLLLRKIKLSKLNLFDYSPFRVSRKRHLLQKRRRNSTKMRAVSHAVSALLQILVTRRKLKLSDMNFFFFFFYEWEYRTGTMCPFSSLHPLKKGKEV